MIASTPSILSHFRSANAVTTIGGACGLAALPCVLRGADSLALTFLIGAILCDRIDGVVARRLEQSSPFGMQLDSLADAVSFLVVPFGIVVLLSDGAGPPAVMAGLYVLAGLWRLAHFNLEGMASEGIFRGIPTTLVGSWFVVGWALMRVLAVPSAGWVLALFLAGMAPGMLARFEVKKNGWLVKPLYALLIPTLMAAWWPL